MAKYVDDKYDHLKSDVDKMRGRYRQYISYSNEAGAKSVTDEILFNALDECKNPRSPGDKVNILFDERDGFITVRDNGRGIPTGLLEELYTSLNMGSNINTSNKAGLKAETLGQNGTGTLAICSLAEHVEITSNRGGTENISKTIVFEEGVKVGEETHKCSKDNHGMEIRYKPSKVMGKRTRIVWDQIRSELLNLQYMNKHKIKMNSIYTNKNGDETIEEYKVLPFTDILLRNEKDKLSSSKFLIDIADDNIIEELDGIQVQRYLNMDIAFVYTTSLSPYIDSFSNSNNTVDGGDHIDAAIEALCRFLQQATKNTLSEKEKNTLDIKWDDVKTGLSIVVSMSTNYERMYTGQTKHKVVSDDLKKIIINMTLDSLNRYFSKNTGQLKDLCAIVKMNAKVRREGDKVRNAVVKGTLSNWSSYKMKNYDPCTNRQLKQYKEIYIIEGDSAKGSLKLARNPVFQALFAIRGVSANVFKMTLDQIVGPKGNKEFTDLITVMGCNIGSKFDLSKLQFNKIIIASDADIDGYFIRSLLLAFFFKIYPEIIEDGRVFIAEPPLYRVGDKNNPFVVNMADYINRYVKAASKNYKFGYQDSKGNIEYLNKDKWVEFLSDTSTYLDDMMQLVDHYKINIRFLEIIIEELAYMKFDPDKYTIPEFIDMINVQHLLNRICEEFPEMYYEEKNKLYKGNIEGTYHAVEISEQMIRKASPLITIMEKWGAEEDGCMILKDIKTGTEHQLSIVNVLKMLKKFQPNIEHRFKGLGENDPDDIKKTIMDPNTRTLIRVHISDIENDMKVFQLLRGSSPLDAQARKDMMKNFKIDKSLIDT